MGLGLNQLWTANGTHSLAKSLLLTVLLLVFGGLEAGCLRKFPQYGRQAVLVAFVCCILAGVSGPDRLNALQTPEGEYFTGLVSQELPQGRGVHTDNYTYLAKIRSGFQGQWLYSNRYTAEVHPPVPLFSFHLMLGQILRLFRLEPTAGLMLSSALFALLPLAPLWKLSGRFLPEPGWRSLAVFTALFGLGWSSFTWLTDLIPKSDNYFRTVPPDLVVPEFTGFQLITRPHWAVALACIVFVFNRLRPDSNWRQGAWVAVAVLILAHIHPFDYLQLALISLVFLLVEACIFKSIPVKNALLMMCYGAMGVIPAAYNWYLLHSNEVLKKTLIDTNQLISPVPLALALGFGSTAVLLLPAVYLHLRRKVECLPELRLLWIWLLVGVALAYAPFSFQRRFLMALYIPAAFLAVFYLRTLMAQARPVVRAFCVGLFIASLLPSTLMLMRVQSSLLKLSHSQALGDMFSWMNEHQVQEKLVFSQVWLGTMIPAFTHHRVWVGHWSETLDYVGKGQSASAFWQMPLEQQRRFLDICSAELFLIAPEDFATVSDLSPLGLRLIHRSGDYRLYQREASKPVQP